MKKLVFLTGAGMSVESGFKTFRGNDGLWENYPVEQIATHEGWEADPTLVTNFYNMLRHKLYAAQPNEGHKLIKDLEKDFEVTVITQNVDNLHEKAGSKNVIHLHGELSKVCSSRNPYDNRYIKELPEDDCEVKPGTEAGDGSLLRPFIVFFGESVPMIEPAAEAVQDADIFVIIGTSLNVYPAAGLISYTKPHIPIYLIDPGAVNTNGYYQIKHIMKGASEGMKELTEILEKRNRYWRRRKNLLSPSHSSFGDIYYIVAELFALLNNIHIYRSDTIRIEMIIHIFYILIAQLVTECIDFCLDIKRTVHIKSMTVVGEHEVHLRQSLIHQQEHLMNVLMLLFGKLLLVIYLSLDASGYIKAAIADTLYL